jgi:WD40 repeat protein
LGEIFISHASADAELAACIAEGIRQAGHNIFVDSDREDGIAPGAAWQRTLFHELRICDVVVFLNSSSGQASKWCHSELVVASELGKRIYPIDVAPHLQPHPLLQSLQSIRLDTTIDASIQRLTDSLALDGLAGGIRFRWERGRPPYPGLAALEVADAGVFFGREDDVRDLLARVDGPLGQRDGDLVVVMGPSGAGKSSLVRAGLAARLAVPHSGWAVASPFEPGLRPLDRLVCSLVALVPGQLTDGECRDWLLNEGMAAFGEWLVARAKFPAKRLLITLDQAEQLATITPRRDGEQFLAMLGGGLGPGSPVTAVMTVRSDRFDEIQRLPVVGPMIHASLAIAPVSRSQLAAVIEGPARRADLAFAPGLVGRLVDDALRGSSEEAAEALPFLAFTLREMYDLAASENRATFTDADYEQVGRIEGAIIKRTEDAEAKLPSGSEPALERLLPRFVTLSDDRLPAGRPVPRERLTTAEQAIVNKLEDQRLLTGAGDTVRLAHERLITAWPRMARLVDDRRDDLLLRARLERQAEDWKQGHGELLGRDASSDASSWLDRRAEPGTERTAVGDYVRASQVAQRRRRARAVAVLSVIVVLALAASVVAVVAVIQRSAAVSQSHIAQSEAMAAQAMNQFSTGAPEAMLLSLQAYETAHTLQAGSALIQAAQQPLDSLLQSGVPVYSVAFSRSGQTLAAGDQTGHIGLWDVATGRRTATLNMGTSFVTSVAFSRSGQTLAAVDQTGHIGLWNVVTRQRTATPNIGNGSPVTTVAFSPSGQTLAAVDVFGHIGLWDVATGQRTANLNEGSSVTTVAFSPSGQTLAARDLSGHIGLWDMATRQRTATLNTGKGSSVTTVAFSPSGQMLAAGDNGGHIGLWDVAMRRRAATLNEGSPVTSVAFSPSGQMLAAGDNGGRIGLWEVATRRRAATLAEGGGVNGVAFSPSGQTLAAGDAGGFIGLWDVAAALRPAALAEGRSVYSVAFSPSGQTLAVGDTGHIGLWDVATGRRIATLTLSNTPQVPGVAFSPNGQILAAGDGGDQIGLWDVATRRRTAALNELGVISVAFSRNGQILAAGDNGQIGLWDVAVRRRTATLNMGNRVPVWSVAFSPSGQTLAAGDNGGQIGLWNVATRRRTATLNLGVPVWSVAFSPSGQTLAAGGNGGQIGLWNVATRRRTATWNEGVQVLSVAFNRNGQILAAGDAVGDIGLWNTSSGQQFANLAETSAGGAVHVAFSPAGQVLAASSASGNIVLLRQALSNPAQDGVIRLICGKIRGLITRNQSVAYASGQPYQRICPAYP